MGTFFKPASQALTREYDLTIGAYKSVAVGADTELAARQSTRTWASLRDSTSAYAQNFDQKVSFKSLPAAAVEILQSVIPSRLVVAFGAAKGSDRFENQSAKGYSAEVFGIKPQQPDVSSTMIPSVG